MKTLLSLAAVTLALVAGPAAAENWHKFSYNSTAAYLADVDSIAVEGDVTSIMVAKVPRTGTASDYHYSVDQFVFRCAARQVRSILNIGYGDDGAEMDRFDDSDVPWDDVVRNSYLEFLKNIACDGARSSDSTWPSIRAFVDSGRGS
ncbi:surface-adhesin E family protein [uncultured Brevundimonas sp.]|uniref:surface-adhesin E family protein n=1 Tax=uncultured Brevundimonas sp. TaxID=213418 RepID=UPI0030EE31E4